MIVPSASPKADATIAEEKEKRLLGLLGELPSAVIAFSGGVDSSFLAHAACRALGAKAVAVTALSPAVPQIQRDMARRVAAQVGIRHIEIQTAELAEPGYRSNSLDRCYFCKSELYARLSDLAEKRGWAVIMSGANQDDLGDHRPGLKAASEQSVRHPLVEVELSKDEIRLLSKKAGLPTWSAPASPCLASRIPFGQEVTAGKLSQIERAEILMRELGFETLRVRHHGDVARIELPVEELVRVVVPALRTAIVDGVKALGFRHVALDLSGFRSGSLHEGLKR